MSLISERPSALMYTCNRSTRLSKNCPQMVQIDRHIFLSDYDLFSAIGLATEF
jgi:hypothetical protein